ncbi:hypothetical protein F511_17758 [Dorcoceras hygrometricum]|uniref:Uncharacterized protein n=1 Tax=Dorcoceras hygrometricum TaxID=472368 RepID=A0A2Z7BGF4_9LAMI|nr:hypothetical protein F511_17758 [Dorcoceras hygrometricum]
MRAVHARWPHMAGVRWALPRVIVARRCPPALRTDCAMMEWPPHCCAPWMPHDCSIGGRPLVAPLRRSSGDVVTADFF